jgi:chromosome segregation and condensation protein ScpB
MHPSPEVSLERDDSRLRPRIEAVALASPEPVTAPHLARALRADEGEVQLAIDGLNAD